MSSFRNTQRKPYSRPAPRGDVDGQWLHDKAPTGPRGRAALGKGAAPAPTGPAVPNSKLIVSNLHYEITPQNLTSVFGQIGTLVREPLLRVRPAPAFHLL
ncbi:hypothetical protein D9619_007891 [Psilocybe cf. subviscida]|uniref:RRM domain-containing protein n=1 Tax=Psilocybe cf. subviscida TaxID=2480587 RepID=A0A8H5ESG4_9AGAR|nr:hypothetical protein D9619_007891 [Psilocybe cf. subviscida]